MHAQVFLCQDVLIKTQDQQLNSYKVSYKVLITSVMKMAIHT